MRIALTLASAGAVVVIAIIATAAYGHRAAQGVPAGFTPQSVAAIGTHDLWVLGGGVMCGGNSCTALVRSTDAGKHFSRVGLPPQTSPKGEMTTVVFANGHVGFAYGNGPLYVTRDGGESWRRAGPAGVSAFATAGGYAYLVDFVAGHYRFERSPVGSDSWQRVKLAVPHFPFSLVARGSNVWFLGPPRRRPDFDTIAFSSDHGRSFASRKGPCLSELGGTLVPAAYRVVWAVCDTGNFSETYRSTDDGRSLRLVRTPGESGAEVAPFSARAAVPDVGGIASLYRTTDGGARWKPVRSTPQDGTILWLRSMTSRLAFAVIETWSSPTWRLWRTTDAGATGHSMPIR